MANVYRRFRTETDFDILDLSDKLCRLTYSYCMNEKRVPKRARLILGQKLIDYADHIREFSQMANDIYADTEDKLADRIRLETRALSYCNLYESKATDMEELLEGVTCENLREIVDILDELIGKIIKWRKTDRVIV